MLYNPRLDVFINVANAGSFTKAAKEEYITPAAVMKQINLLEKELGVQLFERTPSGALPDERRAYALSRRAGADSGDAQRGGARAECGARQK